MALGQTDGGASKDALHAIRKAQKAGGSVGNQHVLRSGFVAFFVVAVQQFWERAARHHGRQLPGRVVSVLDARVAAALTKRADHMRCIANKKHPATAQLVNAFAAVGLRADPNDVVLARACNPAQLAIDAVAHNVFTADLLRVGIGPHLVVDAQLPNRTNTPRHARQKCGPHCTARPWRQCGRRAPRA